MAKTKVTKKEEPIKFPSSVLRPVQTFLQDQLHVLDRQKKNLKEEDPFSNHARADDNAALDTEAEEQFGHATTSALREQIDKKRIEIRKALTRIKLGKYGICENCGKMIDTDRLMVYPQASLCVSCEKKK
ncbi:MAG TPA: TraR/DksA C4-type zinc finger protein [Patescibacteria group bacterium]|nr:TraR/DksA C4-type zinc finger protein [Patescibacteria group bacterium]